ncbi:MAG: 8-oxo-dGTP diphosphatase MutT [Pseudomonadota bacterium]
MAISSSNSPLILVAAAALVREDGRLLLAQRPEGKSMAGLWEFPGGKVETGERPEDALVRELDEELGLKTVAADFTPFAFASHAYDDFHLLMPVFLCRRWRGEPAGIEGQELAWVSAEDAKTFPTPPADIGLMERFAEWSAGQTASQNAGLAR